MFMLLIVMCFTSLNNDELLIRPFIGNAVYEHLTVPSHVRNTQHDSKL